MKRPEMTDVPKPQRISEPDEQAIAAQKQWIETGTVPVSYVESTVGSSFSNREGPVAYVVASLNRSTK